VRGLVGTADPGARLLEERFAHLSKAPEQSNNNSLESETILAEMKAVCSVLLSQNLKKELL
jgi:hypothetical protein